MFTVSQNPHILFRSELYNKDSAVNYQKPQGEVSG